MTSLSTNIKTRIDKLGWSGRRLAKEVGVSSTVINKLINGSNQRSSRLVDIAKALGCTVEDLTRDQNDDIAVHTVSGKTPVLNNELEAVSDEYYTCPIKCSDQTFAYVVDELTMQPEFYKNDIVFIDPAIEASDGCYVAVKLNNEVAIMKLVYSRNKAYLAVLNSTLSSEMIETNVKNDVVGVVICKLKKYIDN